MVGDMAFEDEYDNDVEEVSRSHPGPIQDS